VTVQHDEVLKNQVQSWHITIPALGGSLFVFDIGVAGQAGMIYYFFGFSLQLAEKTMPSDRLSIYKTVTRLALGGDRANSC
jgi:hypothetical protein